MQTSFRGTFKCIGAPLKCMQLIGNEYFLTAMLDEPLRLYHIDNKQLVLRSTEIVESSYNSGSAYVKTKSGSEYYFLERKKK